MSIHYCAECHVFISATMVDDAVGCVDCGRVFCRPEHLAEHVELGTCPEKADGVLGAASLDDDALADDFAGAFLAGLLVREAAASVALDGETQILGPVTVDGEQT